MKQVILIFYCIVSAQKSKSNKNLHVLTEFYRFFEDNQFLKPISYILFQLQKCFSTLLKAKMKENTDLSAEYDQE